MRTIFRSIALLTALLLLTAAACRTTGGGSPDHVGAHGSVTIDLP